MKPKKSQLDSFKDCLPQTVRRALSFMYGKTGLRVPVLNPIVWDHLKRLTVEPIVLAVEEFKGEFAIDVRSDLFSRLISVGYYEPELAALAEYSVDSTGDAVDIGANVGFFSCLLSQLIGGRTILACEPTASALRLLNGNLERNNCKNVKVFPGAVSNLQGLTEIAYIEGREEYSSIDRIDHSCGTGTVTVSKVESRTLDDLVDSHDLFPRFIKCDVEGAEYLVFDGGRKVLGEHRPVVISEVDDRLLRGKGASTGALLELFKSFDYEIRDAYNPSKFGFNKLTGDFVAVPSERSKSYFNNFK